METCLSRDFSKISEKDMLIGSFRDPLCTAWPSLSLLDQIFNSWCNSIIAVRLYCIKLAKKIMSVPVGHSVGEETSGNVR